MLINSNGMNIIININEVETIIIPSPKALKNKMKGNDIVLKRATMINIISYNLEKENYIKNNHNIDVVYYDNYTQAIK